MNPQRRRLHLNQRRNSLNPVPLTDTPVSFAIIILCAIIFFIRYQPPGMALWPAGSGFFSPWQLLTYAFLHGSFNHLFFNMFAVWMFGTPLERSWGSQRFLTYYGVCVVGAGIIQLLVQLFEGGIYPTIGASGGVFGLFQMVCADLRRHRITVRRNPGHAGYSALRSLGWNDIRGCIIV
jgi:membrane associated rhomboid family serine protease